MTNLKPENYLYWLKVCAKLPLPMLQDFEDAVEALKTLLCCIFKVWGRMLILSLYPISVPILAYCCLRANIKAVERSNEAQEEIEKARWKLVQKIEGEKNEIHT